MVNKIVTQVNMNRSVGFNDAVYEDDTFTATGATTLKKGTILARDSSTLKLVVYVKGGSTNENGIPKVVLPEEVTTTGAGDIAVRVLVKGEAVKQRLVIQADGDDSNIDAAVKDQLRSYGITPRESREILEQEP